MRWVGGESGEGRWWSSGVSWGFVKERLVVRMGFYMEESSENGGIYRTVAAFTRMDFYCLNGVHSVEWKALFGRMESPIRSNIK